MYVKEILCIMKQGPAASVLLLVVLSGATVGNKSTPYAWPKVLLIGDSITEKAVGPASAPWSAMLSQYLHRKADVVNRGASGYTTRGYKTIFQEAVQELDPHSVAVVLIFLGANDADQPPSAAYVPLTEYQNNLRDLIQLLQEFGVGTDRMILLPPPPFYLTTPGQQRTPGNSRVPQVTEMYARSALRVAETTGIATVDIHKIFRNDPRAGKLFADGLHFNLEGAELFYESVLPAIESKLQEYEGRQQLLHHFPPPY